MVGHHMLTLTLISHWLSAGAAAVLLTGIPFSWSAIVTILNSRHAKRTGEMYWHCIGPMAVGTAALALLAAALGRAPWAAFAGVLLAASSQASNPLARSCFFACR